MNIKKDVLDLIYLETKNMIYESGGILGEKENIITNADIDKGVHRAKCLYEPNVDRFNIVIHEWQKKEIGFAGVFHTHFFGVSTLSEGDIEYIKSIMIAMPKELTQLYFPIVLPESKKIIPYFAVRDEDTIKIELGELNIID